MILNQQPLIAVIDSGLDQATIDWLLSFDDYVRSRSYSHDDPNKEFSVQRSSLSLFDWDQQFHHVQAQMLARIQQELGRDHPQINCESIQLTRYRPGQEYRDHYDHFNLQGYEKTVDNDRIATALLYLNDGFTGGQTEFPLLNISVVPRQGDILYFEYPSELADLLLHAGRPVQQGEKRIVSLWIRAQPWTAQDSVPDPRAL